MNIIIVGSRAVESLEQHLSDSFRALGHQSSVMDIVDGLPVSSTINYWLSRFVDAYDRLVCQRLADRIAALKPDLVLVVYRFTHPVLVEWLKIWLPGVPLVQLNPDALSNLEKQQIIAANFDYYFSKEPYLVDALRHKAGLNVYYLPEGFNPRLHRKPPTEKAVAEQRTGIDVLVYGSLYGYRTRLVEQLLRAGIAVTVYGTKGPYISPSVKNVFQDQYLAGPEKNQLLYGAKIVLNTLHYAEISGVNQKYFESNGIGAFQLCDYKPTIDEYSGVPADLVTYRSMNEAIDKIRYYLAHPAMRHDLAARQYAHFQAHHTFDQRMEQLLQTVGLGKSAPYELPKFSNQ